jgi:hypothetical protein
MNEELDLLQYIAKLKEDIRQFREFYKAGMQSVLDMYPGKFSLEEWDEQFLIWLLDIKRQ